MCTQRNRERWVLAVRDRIQRLETFHALWLFGALALAACASDPPVDQVELMPAPDVYGDGLFNPLPEYDPLEKIPYDGMLFATDRMPAGAEDEEKYYLNDRGRILRVGVAQVQLGEKQFEWDKVREISMLTSRTEKYPVKISAVDEWGMLSETVPFWIDMDLETDGNPPPDAAGRFAEAINAQMEQSGRKDVFIHVHGYKVVYENPVLISAELWHFLGYEGAFIAYAWPSTPSRFAYIKDSDTSAGYSRNFSLVLEFIAENTAAENVHVLGYSNGTRLVTRALEQLALKHHAESPEKIFEKLRIRNVILVGSDLDRGVFDSYLADGILNTTKHLTVYMSKYDKALGVTQFLTNRQRVGQMFGDAGGEMSKSGPNALIAYRDRISLINVSDAEGAGTGNGHGYFRSSPWASSDVLMTLYYGLSPQQRGLVEQDDLPVYTFPPDYIERLWDAIEGVDPEFARKYKAMKTSSAK